MIPSCNRIEISVKGDTCVLLGVKGLFFSLLPTGPASNNGRTLGPNGSAGPAPRGPGLPCGRTPQTHRLVDERREAHAGALHPLPVRGTANIFSLQNAQKLVEML